MSGIQERQTVLIAHPLFQSSPVTKSLEQERLFVRYNVIFTFETYGGSIKENVTISHLRLNRSLIGQIQQTGSIGIIWFMHFQFLLINSQINV